MTSINKEFIDWAVADVIGEVSAAGNYKGVHAALDEEKYSFFDMLRGKPDDFVVDGIYDEGPDSRIAGNVEVDTADELAYAFESLAMQTDNVLPARDIQIILDHEKRHAYVLQRMRVRAVRYGLTI